MESNLALWKQDAEQQNGRTGKAVGTTGGKTRKAVGTTGGTATRRNRLIQEGFCI